MLGEDEGAMPPPLDGSQQHFWWQVGIEQAFDELVSKAPSLLGNMNLTLCLGARNTELGGRRY